MDKEYEELPEELIKYYENVEQIQELLDIYGTSGKKVCIRYNDSFVYSDKTLEENFKPVDESKIEEQEKLKEILKIEPESRTQGDQEFLLQYEQKQKREELENKIRENRLLKIDEREKTIQLSTQIEDKRLELEELSKIEMEKNELM